MTATFIVRGDQLPVLTPLTSEQSLDLGVARALVYGVDLTAASSPRSAHKQLRARSRDAAGDASPLPGLAHMFVVYAHGPTVRKGSCQTAAGQIAATLHAEFERGRGRYVEVVLIDASGWGDGETLRERIIQAVSTPAGVAGDIALNWRAIAGRSIHQAAMADLC